LVNALKAHKSIEPAAFVDDNSAMQGMTVSGLKVYAPAHIRDAVARHKIDRVLLAIPSLSFPKQMQIAHRLEKMGLEVQALPSFAQLIGEEPLLDKLRPLTPNKLLGRHALDQELSNRAETYAGKSVMVTGAGGSIGSELCRQVLTCSPARLVLFELSELALYTIEQELRPLAQEAGIALVAVLGSATDPRIVRRVLRDNQIDVVLHAAAYKHVPLVEANPLVGLANNVLGTTTLAREAKEAGVQRFILVSSDKAVRPTNIMGASKRLAEMALQDIASRSRSTVFAMVRFGNVLGSSGSVVPLFQDQIARGGPVTLTHPDVTRYFMTVQEASRLVLLAGSYARGGEVFVLDMGAPVAIRTLARQAIEASGYSVRDAANPDGDIEISIIGLRDGEKLHEELLIGEGLLTTPHPKILCAQEKGLSEIEMASAMRALRAAVASGDSEAAVAVARRWVEGYAPPHTPKAIIMSLPRPKPACASCHRPETSG
jgi:FlaA1/EpsC-like NDP-sugar epimerase